MLLIPTREQYTYAIDGKEREKVKNDWMDPDNVLTRSTGQKDKGADASVGALYNEIYAPFAKWSHVPEQLVAYEVDDGWEMIDTDQKGTYWFKRRTR